MKELAFSFYHCAPLPQELHFTVLSDWSDLLDYTVIAEAARNFCGWLTVTADTVIRNVVQAF